MAFSHPFYNEQFTSRFNNGVRLISNCPLCQTIYRPASTRVLVTREDAHLVHLKCSQCGCGIVALVVNNLLGISSVGLLTDLTPEDVLKFRHTDSVSADDVIELHTWLESGRSIPQE